MTIPPPHQFEERTILQRSGQWVVDIREGDEIDDIRIYIQDLTPAKGSRLTSNWDTVKGGYTDLVQFRSDGNRPLVVVLAVNRTQIEAQVQLFANSSLASPNQWRESFYKKFVNHELGHVFGIGISPAWTGGIGQGNGTLIFTGDNALREYRAMFPDKNASGIPVSGFAPYGDGHWVFDFPLWCFFDFYWMQDNGTAGVSRITLGAFADIGWDVNYDLGADTLPSIGRDLTPCWLQGDEGNFHLCE